MTPAHDVPIPYRIVALMQEQNRLFAYPLERLAIEIWSTKFQCSQCGACCTRAVNRHIFLLDHDVNLIKKIDPDAYVPAPEPEFCDQNGMLYVSGYALKMRDDPRESCWFLENNRCSIYDNRLSGCRIYPHMLRRSPDATGTVTWQRFAHRNEHGETVTARSLEECLTLAREIKEYETAFLNQQISFLETIHEYFTVHRLRHDPAMHRDCMNQFRRGEPVDVKVFHEGELELCRVGR